LNEAKNAAGFDAFFKSFEFQKKVEESLIFDVKAISKQTNSDSVVSDVHIKFESGVHLNSLKGSVKVPRLNLEINSVGFQNLIFSSASVQDLELQDIREEFLDFISIEVFSLKRNSWARNISFVSDDSSILLSSPKEKVKFLLDSFYADSFFFEEGLELKGYVRDANVMLLSDTAHAGDDLEYSSVFSKRGSANDKFVSFTFASLNTGKIPVTKYDLSVCIESPRIVLNKELLQIATNFQSFTQKSSNSISLSTCSIKLKDPLTIFHVESSNLQFSYFYLIDLEEIRLLKKYSIEQSSICGNHNLLYENYSADLIRLHVQRSPLRSGLKMSHILEYSDFLISSSQTVFQIDDESSLKILNLNGPRICCYLDEFDVSFASEVLKKSQSAVKYSSFTKLSTIFKMDCPLVDIHLCASPFQEISSSKFSSLSFSEIVISGETSSAEKFVILLNSYLN
jgi:hypothetical protein